MTTAAPRHLRVTSVASGGCGGSSPRIGIEVEIKL
jgi:hypothetical protein